MTLTTWSLMVLMLGFINGQPVYIPVVLSPAPTFLAGEACAAEGRRYASPRTKVICFSDAGDVQEVQP